MAVSFGTSGLRGLVSALSDEVVQGYVRAFLACCSQGSGLYVGQDLRSSSPRIAQSVIAAARAEGCDVTDCGPVPTPALAFAAQQAGAGAIMVTGSHIPDDRNGLKFYTPQGEITKANEAAIVAAVLAGQGKGQGLGQGLGLGQGASGPPRQGNLAMWPQALGHFARRYVAAFGPKALSGLRLGIYQHSSVARDLLVEVVAALGAQPVALARADRFIPLDTEALPKQTRAMLRDWANGLALDAILSSDGDADRPLLAGADGQVIPGDLLGTIAALALGARSICTPITSNSLIESLAAFQKVSRCKIGSPFVIAAMRQELAQNPMARVVGFEANGGFLLGFAAQGPQGPLAPLFTRDAVLPMIAALAFAQAQGKTLSDLLGAFPARRTAADRLPGIPTAHGAAFLRQLHDVDARAAFVAPWGKVRALDETDGLRITLDDGQVLHLRNSGNAPEFRLYVEAQTDLAAQRLLQSALQACQHALEHIGSAA